MSKSALLVLLSLVALPALAQVKIETQDMGEIYQTNTGHSTILITNVSDKPVSIDSITPAYDKDGVGDFKLPAVVVPGTSVNVPVKIFTAMAAGVSNHLFNITTNNSSQSKHQVQVHFYGLSVLDDPKPKVDLGTINTNAVVPEKMVTLSSREIPNFQITRIVGVPDFVAAKVLADGRSVAITGKTDASWGRHEGYVEVALNSTVQTQAWIAVSADVHGDVIPSTNPVVMGMFRTTKLPFVVQLRSRDGKPVRLGTLELKGFRGVATKEPCVGGTRGCAQISVKVPDDVNTGVVRGELLVDLPDYHRQLPIGMGGFYLPESVKVKSLNDEMERNTKSSAEPPPLDLKSALEKSTQVAPPPAADPPGHGPLLKWQVSNENNMYGYLIYRGDNENGPFLRVNKDIVHVGPDKGDGITSSYAWRDDSATAGKTYWYYIGMLKRDGTKQQLSGPQEVKAK